MGKSEIKTRYGCVDTARGFAVLSMVIYHFCYDIFCVFGVDPGFALYPAVMVWERTICVTFIAVSGISLNFTSHGYRRGLIVNLCGLGITVVTALFIPEQQIWFGVLNLLGCSMMIVFALREQLNRLAPAAGMAASAALWALTYGLPQRYLGPFRLPDALYGCKYLAFLGFPSADFYSVDYFPLLPWIFMFLFGYFLWRFVESKGLRDRFTGRIPVFDFLGRHSLLIYILHQPILYGLSWLLFRQ